MATATKSQSWSNDDFMDTAMEYVFGNGWSIIPLTYPLANNEWADGKRPAVQEWKAYQERLPTKEEIGVWFSTQRNVGVITGTISNLAVLDLDNETAYQKIASVFPDLQQFLTVKTGKGYHIYFCPSAHVATSTFILDDAVHHVKQEGGYVVAPPSLHKSGNRYRFIGGLLNDLDLRQLVEVIKEAGGVPRSSEHRPNRAVTWASELCETVPEGQRNTSATQLCGLLIRKFRYDKGLILGLMRAWNNMYCKPPLPATELDRLVELEWNRYAGKE